ncbi:MAG: abortive infection system antitoxin AbiGi family protein [Treponema sp.]|nr:abortive infection system antitoxin AbiGi family protein [Treponema sp.]
MSLSSNSVIHYTRTLDALKGIIRDRKFLLGYCTDYIREENSIETAYFPIAVPMVSFCDIPFTEVSSLTKEYGCYGIGLSKEWALKKGLNPVLYFDSKSKVTRIFNAIEYLSSTICNNTEEDFTHFKSKQLLQELEGLLGYIKNYQNKNTQVGKIPPNYKFYNEREWRYVPSKNDLIDGELDLLLQKEKYEEDKDFYNNRAKKYSLTFEEGDISYIILEKKSEIHEMLVFLKEIGIKTPELCTKIISLEQIENDF